MNTEITLIKNTYIEDELGQQIPGEEITYGILAEVATANRSEFFSAARAGIRADMMFVTNAVNYSDEEELEYKGVRYSIYRVYNIPESDDIEIYVKRKAGVI